MGSVGGTRKDRVRNKNLIININQNQSRVGKAEWELHHQYLKARQPQHEQKVAGGQDMETRNMDLVIPYQVRSTSARVARPYLVRTSIEWLEAYILCRMLCTRLVCPYKP
jgi:hypothetical protein